MTARDHTPSVAETTLRLVDAADALVDFLALHRDAFSAELNALLDELDAALTDFHGLKMPDQGEGGTDAGR